MIQKLVAVLSVGISLAACGGDPVGTEGAENNVVSNFDMSLAYNRSFSQF